MTQSKAEESVTVWRNKSPPIVDLLGVEKAALSTNHIDEATIDA